MDGCYLVFVLSVGLIDTIFMKNKRWRIADLIDLEFFLDQDDREDLDQLAARDREIYTRLRALAPETQHTRSALLQGWLADRKRAVAETLSETVLPGRIWQEFFMLFFWGILVSGLLSGGMLAFSFLDYSGARPVNVSAYFGIFVVFEIVLFLLFIVLALYRRLLGRGLESSFLYRMFRRFFYRILTAVSRRAGAGIAAETRDQWSARVGSMHQLQQRYGKLFIRPFFLLAQLFGISFNAGVLAATLLKVIGSDVAFGWQTTLQISAEAVYTLVRWISLPWSWLLPSYGCPSMAQIQGSKLILKDGIYHLATHDLVSWWPFLCLSVVFYGLLPRLILFVYGIFQQLRELNGLRFNHGRYRQLVHRMQTPLVSTRATVETEEQRREQEPREESIEVQEDRGRGEEPEVTSSPENVSGMATLLALVPDELFEDCPQKEFKQQVRARLGYDITAILPVWTLEQSEDEDLETVRTTMRTKKCEDVLLLQEAWQPPIQELLSFLEKLRRITGEQSTLIVALVGKPAAGTMLTPVEPLNLQIWQRKISTLADQGLQLVELVK